MSESLITTKGLMGARVIGGKRLPHKIGTLDDVVFHPAKKRVVGFIVKRSDFLWMFKRKDWFVSIEGYAFINEQVVILNKKGATNNAAYKALSLDPDDCRHWIGMPAITKSGKNFGIVSTVTFDRRTGKVYSLELGGGSVENILFGTREILATMIRGYGRVTKAQTQTSSKTKRADSKEPYTRALVVSAKIEDVQIADGLAKKTGKRAAQAKTTAGKAGSKASINARAASRVAETMIVDGAVATGKQLKKTKGMFKAFKDEYDKAKS